MKTSLRVLTANLILVLVPGLLLFQGYASSDTAPKLATTATPKPSPQASSVSKSSFPFRISIKIIETPTPQPTRPTSIQTVAGQLLQISFNALFGKPEREMDLWVEARGKAVAKAVAWRCVDRRAVDDTGRNLRFDLYPLTWHWNRTIPEDRAIFSIKLNVPATQARFIREYAGNIEFILPQSDPNSRIVLNRFRMQMGKPLQALALKKQRLTVVVLTKENYEQRKTRRDVASQALVRDFAAVFANSNRPYNVAIRVKNAREILGRVAFTDPKGRELPHDGCALMGSFIDCAFKSRVPDSTQLTLDFATPKSVFIVPFELKQIPLASKKPLPGS